jgi:hypothetical protein
VTCITDQAAVIMGVLVLVNGIGALQPDETKQQQRNEQCSPPSPN